MVFDFVRVFFAFAPQELPKSPLRAPTLAIPAPRRSLRLFVPFPCYFISSFPSFIFLLFLPSFLHAPVLFCFLPVLCVVLFSCHFPPFLCPLCFFTLFFLPLLIIPFPFSSHFTPLQVASTQNHYALAAIRNMTIQIHSILLSKN